MKKIKNKRSIILILLSLTSACILFYGLIPSISYFYKLNKSYTYEKNTIRQLKINIKKDNKIKTIKFTAGKHEFYSYMVSFLSYARYLKENGFNIGISIQKTENRKNVQDVYLKITNFTVALSNFSDIDALFSLIKTLKSFPFEIKKINIKSGRKIDAIINAELIGFK
ncbi:MAG: hypothetical protein M0Z57_05765 [Deltaproteobacteria bacterium]|jgi:hypothetical protein|uniref:Uncharacterized protein n=1 Tax=Candidatus Acidulodesulfobacterium acidiphilum TaxID=2597224 RepID=A0A520XET0_9DELT|nr:hypothetical protein [Deltaproteobacteria bacterium]RZV39672.1 MAG: hypothetical protein EVJ48_03955 [Candidatus Acidulodesulfobacterium acidiphilum]